MSRRADAMRHENERIKRESEARLQRKREKEMGTPERPPSPGVNPRKDSAPILRNLSPKIILAIMAVAAVTLIYLVFSDGRSTAVVPLDDAGDEEPEELASLMEQGAEVNAADGGFGEVDEQPQPQGGAAFADEEHLMGDNGELVEGGGQVAEESVLPPWQESGADVDEVPVVEAPAHPPAPPMHPPATPQSPPPPETPPKASMRWASLKLPEQCFMFPSAPHGVLPGLEHYSFGASGGADAASHTHAHPAAAEAHQAPLEETPITVVEEEAPEGEASSAEQAEVAGVSEEEEDLTHLSNAADQSQVGDEEAVAEVEAELEGEQRTMAVDSSLQEGEPTQAGESFRSLEVEGAGAGDAAVVDDNYRRRHRHRRLLGKAAKKSRPVEEMLGEMVAKDAMLMKGLTSSSSPEYGQSYSDVSGAAGAAPGAAGGAVENPNQGVGLMPTSSELKAMNLLLNVSVVDSACQFLTKECAEAAAQSLATTLRSDAEAVSNPSITAEELRRVTKNLASMHTDSRSMLNATELPSLGMNGDLGNCAFAGESEYDPETHQRYDAFTSRFAVAIDRHDVLIHCSNSMHFCTLTRMQGSQVTETVRLDAQSFMKAKAAGQAIHQLLAEDGDLSEGVEAWGHTDEPTHAFVTLMMVLRSGLCQRVDVYGQPGVPTAWFHNLGNGHIVTQPADTPTDRAMAATLQQERFLLRVAVHVFEGRMCFYK